MNNQRSQNVDDALLIDFHWGACSPEEAQRVRDRLQQDPEFSRRSSNIVGLLKLLDQHPAPEPGEELFSRTLAAIDSAGRTSNLIYREAAQERRVGISTFNLKELAAMAAMVVLLASVLVPSLRQARTLSQQQACVARTGEIGTALTHYANQNSGFLPALAARHAAWLDADTAPVRMSNSRNLWKLVSGRYATPTLFQCPAGEVKNFAVASEMPDFPSQEFITYSYHDSVNSEPINVGSPTLRGVTSSMAILADRTPIFQDGRFNRDRLGCQNSPNHDSRGQSVLYLDSHAAWKDGGCVGVNGDNIWLVQGVTDYIGIERPAQDTDSFLLPSFVEAGR